MWRWLREYGQMGYNGGRYISTYDREGFDILAAEILRMRECKQVDVEVQILTVAAIVRIYEKWAGVFLMAINGCSKWIFHCLHVLTRHLTRVCEENLHWN